MRVKKNQRNPGSDTTIKINMRIMGILEGEKREKGTETETEIEEGEVTEAQR